MPEQSAEKGKTELNTAMVRHVAMLVRLGLTEEEARTFSSQFREIIGYFQLLNEVNTEGVLPANEISSLRSVMRPDETRPSMPREEFLKNVPRQEDGVVVVPPVFGEE